MKPIWGIVVNANAGRGKTLRLLPTLKKELEKNGIAHTLKITYSPDELNGVFDRFSEIGIKAIMSVGGDGTANNLAPFLLKRDLPLLVIPMGTGNDYARSLYGEIDWCQLIKRIGEKKYKVELVDTGILETENRKKVFLNGMGIGIDGEVVQKIEDIPFLTGDLLYLAGLFRAFLSYRPRKVRIHSGDSDFSKRALLLTIGIGKYLGGNFLLHPKAELQDGLFDVSFIESLSFLKILFKLPLVTKGKHTREKEVHYFKAKSLSFEAESPLYLHTDGELFSVPIKKGKIYLIPRNLKIIKPLN